MTTSHAPTSSADPSAPSSLSGSDFAAQWQRWHDDNERRRTDPHGFFAIVGLTWLDAEPVAIPGLPGLWSTTDQTGPVIDLAEGETLTRDGQELRGRVELGPIAERGDIALDAGDVRIEVARRGGRDIVRPRDPSSPLLSTYTGTDAYAPDPEWAVSARFVPFDEPEHVRVGSAAPTIHHDYDALGAFEFEHDGTQYRLLAFPGHAPGSYNVLIRDATSGVTTYAANRSLSVTGVAADGSAVLDFNRASNLPCAYTDFATCPLPPKENILPFPVEAGERIPSERLLANGEVQRAGA